MLTCLNQPRPLSFQPPTLVNLSLPFTLYLTTPYNPYNMRFSAVIVVSALAVFNHGVAAAPATTKGHFAAPRVHDAPAFRSRYYGLERRQYHSPDYGSNEQPSVPSSTAQASPTPASSSGKTRRDSEKKPIYGYRNPIAENSRYTKRDESSESSAGHDQLRYGHAVPPRKEVRAMSQQDDRVLL